jgi:sulfite exporter TauE/SafE
VTLALAVLVASLLGSEHCAAMCGAFVCFYTSGTPTRASAWHEDARAHVAYNLGRLMSYLLLGVVGGAAGRTLNTAGTLAGVQRAAAIVAGTLMILWGGHSVLVALGVRAYVPTAPDAWRRAMGGVLAHLREQPPVVRAAATGLATTLLPCGWLYAFVVTAAATGSASGGATVMFVFWLGTLPMMLAVGVGARRLMGRFGARMPIVSGTAIIVLGILSVAGRIGVNANHATHAMHAMHAVQAGPLP